ncbi:acid protease [Hysterangium stoloniferum]|nr:acid protease [Hysterangium stoloniferum]
MHALFAFALLLPRVLALSPPNVHIRDSPITLPTALRVNTTGLTNILTADRARARLFVQKAQEKAAKVQAGTLSADAAIGIPITNEAISYIASVGIGSPPTQYNLTVDTGSANLVIFTDNYIRTSSSFSTSNQAVQCMFSIVHSYSGELISVMPVVDQVTLGPGLVIQRQSISVCAASPGFDGFEGILGLGPTDLTLGTLFPASGATVPTVTDNLFSQGTITLDEIAISFEPTNSSLVVNGEITFGGTDPSKFTGPITFTPITSTSPASEFWGIDQSIKFGTTTILSTTAGIVDTGTILMLIATNAFNTYKSATGAVLDNNTGLLRLTTTQFANLTSLFFVIGGTTFEFTANAQAWPRSLNTLIGGSVDNVYLIVGDLGTPSGEGLDFINGQMFLERFYSVYDTTNRRVGFATTPFTTATTN